MAVLPPDPVFTLRSAELAPVHSICFDCDGANQQLLAGTQDGKIFTWSLATNRPIHKLSVGETTVLNLQRAGDKLYTQEKEGTIKIWKKTESDYILQTTVNSGYCGFCRFQTSDSNDMLIGPERDSKIVLYSAEGETIATLPLESDTKVGEVMCFKYLEISDNKYILAAYESGDLYMWDLKTHKTLSNVKLRDFPLALDYDVTSGRGIYGNASENIQVFSIGRNDSSLSLKCEIIMKNPGVNVLKIRQDRKVFASGGWDGRLRVYSWKSLRPLAVLTEHKASIQDVCYSKVPIDMWTSPIMAACGLDSSVTLWDIYN